MHSLISFRTPPPPFRISNHQPCSVYGKVVHIDREPTVLAHDVQVVDTCVYVNVRDAHSVPITGDPSCYAQSKSSSPCHVVFHSCNRVNLVHHLPSSLSLIFLN